MSTLKVAAIQYDIKWLQKQHNLEQLAKILATIAQADLILLPETFSTGFAIDVQGCEEAEQGGLVLDWMRQQAKIKHSVIAGSVLVSHQGKKVNRFYWVTPEGIVEYYDKRHLFRLGNEQAHVVQGQKRSILQIKGVNILPSVCYDLRFPVWLRNRQDYDVMINVANWPAVRRQVWDTLLSARAIENQCFVIGVNRVGEDGRATPHSGGTAAYDYTGACIARVADNQQGILKMELDLNNLATFKRQFPAFLDADDFSLSV